MKKIWNFLKKHVSEDFNGRYYAVIAVFLILSISLNYAFDFEDNELETMEGYPKFFAYVLFYSIPYFFSVYMYAVFKKRKDIFSRRDFWIKSLLAIAVLSLDSSVPFLDPLVSRIFHPEMYFWAYKVCINSVSFFTVFIPIFIFYWLHERKHDHVYGLSARKFDAKPYFTMLLIMLPLIIGASFHESFQRQYPMYKSTEAHVYMNVPEWVTVAGYEFAYGLDFITVEYLFRGFMVIGMMSILGRGAVVCMAVVYCFLHFGKPAGEAISSIAGGYILGVVAYETRSIWGGIIVHMGIAWIMELVAFLQKSV
ncbi:CPBP family intramembrane metalloprotease [Fulvivirgaceae bacterium PWU4]|uniref:CPBP family intramembrane metalloprotease n=1 Tax=Chryseosolibacter histidini TaxID=2782349 RepID=A0AAP2DK24_9BACT|nr:CPBP family intramembrane glutamic endopeptidase [Chryseosolibacter histidini]MBT1697770.1 CPBP family intramembrane metalloprotease [Chryseosolibacter histidini]